MNNKAIMWVIVALVVIGVIVALVRNNHNKQSGDQNNTVKSGEPIKIGFISPLTGDAASIGTVARAAVQVAVEEVNQAGGINGRQISMIYEDGKCNAGAATNAASKLINADKVVAIVGGLCSTETAAFGPMAMQNKVLVMSYASSAPTLSNLGKYFFRDYPSDIFQGKFGAEYAYNTLGARKVAVLYHESDYGTGIKNVFVSRFKELGGEILSEEGAPQESRDYRTQLSKIKALNPDLIYAPTYPEGATVLIQQARDLGINAKLLAADAWDDTKLQQTENNKGDIYYTGGFTGFNDDFKAKVFAITKGDQLTIGSSQAYDAIKILAQVMEKVGTDPDKVQAELRNVDYNGLSGHIKFDDHGDLTEPHYTVKKFQDGKAVEVK